MAGHSKANQPHRAAQRFRVTRFRQCAVLDYRSVAAKRVKDTGDAVGDAKLVSILGSTGRIPAPKNSQQDPLRLSTAHRSGLLIGTAACTQGCMKPGSSPRAVLTPTPRPERSEAGFSFEEMSMEAKRGRRIRDKLRMKLKAAKLYPHDPKRRNADNLAACSCWMCGNPRRYFGQRTIKERQADDWKALQGDWKAMGF